MTGPQKRYWLSLGFGLLAGLVFLFGYFVLPRLGWNSWQLFFFWLPLIGLIFAVIPLFRRWEKNINKGLQDFARTQQWQSTTNPPSELTWSDHLLLDSNQGKSTPPIIQSYQSPDRLMLLTRLGAIPGQSNLSPIFFSTLLSKKLPGWLHLESNIQGFSWPKEVDLESYEYNLATHTRASERSLPSKVLSPDTMAWYMDLEVKPWIHIERKALFVGLDTGQSVNKLSEVFKTMNYFLRAIEKSGGLE